MPEAVTPSLPPGFSPCCHPCPPIHSPCCRCPCCLQLDVPEALHHLKPHPTNRRPACEAVMQQASSSAPMFSMVQGYTLQEPHVPAFLAGSSPCISASSCSSAPMPVPCGGGGGGGRCSSSYMEGEQQRCRLGSAGTGVQPSLHHVLSARRHCLCSLQPAVCCLQRTVNMC
jgi:hypothetical protein